MVLSFLPPPVPSHKQYFACVYGPVVINPAEPTDPTENKSGQNPFFPPGHFPSPTPSAAAHTQGNRAQWQGSREQGSFPSATLACVDCRGAALQVLQNLKDSIDQIIGT